MDDKSKKKTGFKPINVFFMVLIGLPVLATVLTFIVLMSPFLLIGFIVYTYFNYRKETLIPRQKHQRAIKNLNYVCS